MLTECTNSSEVLFCFSSKICDFKRDRTDNIFDIGTGFMLFQRLWTTSSLWMLRIALLPILFLLRICKHLTFLFLLPSSQKTAGTYFLTVKPKCEAPSSAMRKWGKGMATGHHKLEPKSQFLCLGFKYIRKAKQLWGRSLSFLCLTEKA